MKTPKAYTKMLKEGYVTESVIGEVLYSINKRAKNWRDKEREYRSKRYDYYGNEEKAREEKEKYYNMKDNILKKFDTKLLHTVDHIGFHNLTTYDYEPDFNEAVDRVGYDNIRTYYDKELRTEVDFVSESVEHCNTEVFKFYNIGDFTFHTPILFVKENDSEAIEEFKKIKMSKEYEIIELRELITEGKEITELLSTTFCKKVYEGILNSKLIIKQL